MNVPKPSAGNQAITLNQSYFSRRNGTDWAFALLMLVAATVVFMRYGAVMDFYEKSILLGTVPSLIWIGWLWRPLRALMVGVAALSLLAISLYQVNGQADLARADTAFLLKYFLSSQSAILWMSVLFFMSTAFYWAGVFLRSNSDAMELLGSRVAWAAVVLALVGTMVRWYEGHQMGPDIGHIPVSNLYEVFILFCWMTAVFYLYYEETYKTRSLGVCHAGGQRGGGLLAVVHGCARSAPDPAFDSRPSELVDEDPRSCQLCGLRYLCHCCHGGFRVPHQQSASETRWYKLAPLWALGVVLCFEPLVFRQGKVEGGSSYWFVYFGISALVVAGILGMRVRLAERLPSFEVMDDVMYKAIAIGLRSSPLRRSWARCGPLKRGVVTGAGTRRKHGP